MGKFYKEIYMFLKTLEKMLKTDKGSDTQQMYRHQTLLLIAIGQYERSSYFQLDYQNFLRDLVLI